MTSCPTFFLPTDIKAADICQLFSLWCNQLLQRWKNSWTSSQCMEYTIISGLKQKVVRTQTKQKRCLASNLTFKGFLDLKLLQNAENYYRMLSNRWSQHPKMEVWQMFKVLLYSCHAHSVTTLKRCATCKTLVNAKKNLNWCRLCITWEKMLCYSCMWDKA